MSWGALFVQHVDVDDGEAGRRQQLGDGTGEVAAPEESLLHRFDTPLPALHVLVGGETMLDEVQRSPWLEDTPHLV